MFASFAKSKDFTLILLIFQFLISFSFSIDITPNSNSQTLTIGSKSIQFSSCSDLGSGYNLCYNINSTHIQMAFSLLQSNAGWIG